MIFRDRTEAGQVLASKLTKYLNQVNTVILALPRGGVPVAYEIGRELGLPVDIFVVRKLGAVPDAAPQTCSEISDEVDEIICAATPEPFYGLVSGTRSSLKLQMKKFATSLRAS
jgi:predicted phosphoribosyltransferase